MFLTASEQREALGSRIQRLRMYRNWNQMELAERANIPKFTLRGYEQNSRQPNWRIFLDLCRALGVDPEFFEDCVSPAKKKKTGKKKRSMKPSTASMN